MVVSHTKSKRKPTGGRYHKFYRKSRKYDMGSLPVLTKIGKRRAKTTRKLGGSFKTGLFSTDTANIVDPSTKKFSVVKIKAIIENPSNRHFVRRGIMTKGAIIETELGKAKVTSRPGQSGMINAVLIK